MKILRLKIVLPQRDGGPLMFINQSYTIIALNSIRVGFTESVWARCVFVCSMKVFPLPSFQSLVLCPNSLLNFFVLCLGAIERCTIITWELFSSTIFSWLILPILICERRMVSNVPCSRWDSSLLDEMVWSSELLVSWYLQFKMTIKQEAKKLILKTTFQNYHAAVHLFVWNFRLFFQNTNWEVF